ncbi:MAG: MFS transporter, partial [Verrucomicrobiia bacterium]
LWGDFCFVLMETVVPSVLPLKLRSLDSPNLLIGFIMTTLPGIFNFTITPWLSFKSDRTRTRWGRRLPFIVMTMPFLSLSLILIGFSPEIGAWVHGRVLSGSGMAQAQVIILLLAVFAAAFDFFNMFVSTVYWYLFNDIVPKEWMGRFTAWFRMISAVTGALYNFFIFRFAESHMREIFLGAALLYLVGFGIMCLRVKEGEYPPPSDDGNRVGLLQKMRIFGRECFTMRYYWDIFLGETCVAMAATIGVFQVFFNKSLGLTLDHIGKMAAVSAITVPVCYFFAGNLVDRWHPVRVCAYFQVYSAFAGLGTWVWLFIPAPPPLLYVWIAILTSAFFQAPMSAMGATAGVPRLMRLLPREQFGQFCGAMAMVRALAVMLGGVLAGAWVDVWKTVFHDANYAYRFNFLYREVLILVAFCFYYRNYRAWKRLGGDATYEPPSQGFRLASLRPLTEAEGGRRWGLVGVVGLAAGGQFLATAAWLVYYTAFEPNVHHAVVFGIGLLGVAAMFLIYLRVIRFMERA